jgi:glutathione S-transferase
MTLKYAGIEFEHREIELKNKPKSMLMVSPKGTVPVLCVDETVIDQSLEIMRWALAKSDPHAWALVDEILAHQWVQKNDGPFKILLDQYKYSDQRLQENSQWVFDEAVKLMLEPMELALRDSNYLFGPNMSWVDVAIFPFVRQFSMVNPKQFQALPFPSIKKWLNEHIKSELFTSVMHKYPSWID